jgi:hypothetical protein
MVKIHYFLCLQDKRERRAGMEANLHVRQAGLVIIREGLRPKMSSSVNTLH